MSDSKQSPWQIADSIFNKTVALDPVAAGYDPWFMNRICANNNDTVYFAEMLNTFPGISKQMSYDFYYYGLERGRRYGKWRKGQDDDEVKCVAAAYGINRRRAAQYIKLLGEEGLKAVIASQEKGGSSTPSKSKKRVAK